MSGLIIFAVQIGLFDIATSVTIRCKFNDCPADVRVCAAKTIMTYLRRTIDRGLIYWRPSGKELSDLHHGSFTPLHPRRAIDSRFPATYPLIDPV
jgi:hypothetical protein